MPLTISLPKRQYRHKPFKKATCKQRKALLELLKKKLSQAELYQAMVKRDLWITCLSGEQPMKWRLNIVLQLMEKIPFLQCPQEHRTLLQLLRQKVGVSGPPPASRPSVPKSFSNQLSLF